MAKLKNNVSQAISDFDAVKAALEKRGIEVGDKPTSEYGPMVEALPQGGDEFAITDASYLFYNGARVDAFDALMKLCEKPVSCRSMFESSKLNEVDVSSLDTSECTDMGRMFYSMFGGTVNGINGLEKLNTSKVTNMADMFGALWLSKNSRLDVSSFDTSNVTNMSGMFAAASLSGVYDLRHFNTSKVTNMSKMFYNNSSLEEVIMTGWDTSKVTNISDMFASCGMKKIDFSSWDTSSLTSVSTLLHQSSRVEEIIGFSIMSKAGVSFTPCPYASETAPYALKRLTFRTDLPEGTYSMRSAISLRYCSFDREGMVEMFNTLPDVSGLGLAASNTKITITGNPCVMNTALAAQTAYKQYGTLEAFQTAASTRYKGYDYKNAPVKYYVAGKNASTAVTGTAEVLENETWQQGGYYVQFLADNIPMPAEDRLSDEDRAIATNKGWTLVE